MKNIVLSADGDRVVYSVPDVVADRLEDYCMEFRCHWLPDSPHAQNYRINGGLCYNEADFIDYLNRWVFPDQPSVLVKNLGWIEFDQPLPEPYRSCPQFNF
ncbi:MAG: hypothetical protein HFF40_04300 [Lawsonibacter sp.]|jgi:hypothetical protein|nr:hypothetical protein [Lawsonibacter sp.]